MKCSGAERQGPTELMTPQGIGKAIAFAACLLLSASAAVADTLRITVRDADNGQFLDATLELTGADSSRATYVVEGGRLQQQFQGESALHLSAYGYQPLSTHLSADTHDLQLWLDPATARHRPANSRTTGASVEGHVYDFQAGVAVAGARVHLGSSTRSTDALGYFQFELGAVESDQGTPVTLSVHADALPLWQQTLRLTNGASHRIIDLGAGAPGPDHRFDSRQLASPLSDAATTRAPVLPVPASIRVGFADAGFTTPCCVGSCSAVSVMSLETYVKRGLNDEWIASWTGDSLRAGAIAYRSYGAWHVANPRSPNYDICSSACCQVNDPDTSTSTNSAVDATAGILLTQGNSAFRSEYSAENNAWDDPNDGLPCSNADLSCGNGFVGSPATGWPCLADSVALGRGCFGHGRGMSQWGSQRWALDQGQRWPWIVNHYYNANGNGAGLRNSELTSPLRIDQFSAPVSASPGQLITLTLELSNLAALAHDPVYLGASLFRSGSGFVSDPPRDLGVRLEPGSQQRSRQFQLPPGMSAGVWDVLVALYLDIDGNGAINSGDLALTSARQNGVLNILESALFVNGFE
jgi:hypothetical protein